MGKAIIIHLLTDGHATDRSGNEDMRSLQNQIKNRTFPGKTYFSIVLCIEDDDIEAAYGRLGEAANVDVSSNYICEAREVRECQGGNYKFTYGDYVAKIMVGSFDKTLGDLDKPRRGCCTIA